jgi:hypothetical protein
MRQLVEADQAVKRETLFPCNDGQRCPSLHIQLGRRAGLPLKMIPKRKNWMGRAGTRLRQALPAGIFLANNGYDALKSRHGSRYANTTLVAIFLALCLPVPGISLVVLAVIVAIAELHRLNSEKGDRGMRMHLLTGFRGVQ